MYSYVSKDKNKDEEEIKVELECINKLKAEILGALACTNKEV